MEASPPDRRFRARLPARLHAALLALAGALLAACFGVTAVQAATVTIARRAIGLEYRLCKQRAEAWARQAGHTVEQVQSPNRSSDRLGLYQQVLAAQSPDIAVFQVDVNWPGLLAAHLADLRPLLPADEPAGQLPALVLLFQRRIVAGLTAAAVKG